MLFILVLAVIVRIFAGVNLWKFVVYIKDELFVALGVHLSFGEQLTAVLVLMLTSKGMAGVPGSSFLALSATVSAIGHGSIPVAAVALLLGADRLMDSMRVPVNLIGNRVTTFVVTNWEGQLDKQRMRLVLNGEPLSPVEEVDAPTGQAEVAAEQVELARDRDGKLN